MSAPSYQDFAVQMGQQYNLPPGLLPWVIQTESSWNPNARNPSPGSTATGIAQFTNATAQSRGVNQLDPYDSIQGAASYLSDLYQQTGSWMGALNAYGTTANSVSKQQQALAIINADQPTMTVNGKTYYGVNSGTDTLWYDTPGIGNGGQQDTSTPGNGNNLNSDNKNTSSKLSGNGGFLGGLTGSLNGIMLFLLGIVLLVLALLNSDQGKQAINIVTSKIKG